MEQKLMRDLRIINHCRCCCSTSSLSLHLKLQCLNLAIFPHHDFPGHHLPLPPPTSTPGHLSWIIWYTKMHVNLHILRQDLHFYFPSRFSSQFFISVEKKMNRGEESRDKIPQDVVNIKPRKKPRFSSCEFKKKSIDFFSNAIKVAQSKLQNILMQHI